MHLSRLGLLVHLVASLPWWHPSTSALPWHGSILGVLMHLAGAARTSAMGVAGIGVHLWWRLLAGCALPIWVAALTKVAAGAYIGITRVAPDVVAGLISSDGWLHLGWTTSINAPASLGDWALPAPTFGLAHDALR